jgi:hypothetical protein
MPHVNFGIRSPSAVPHTCFPLLLFVYRVWLWLTNWLPVQPWGVQLLWTSVFLISKVGSKNPCRHLIDWFLIMDFRLTWELLYSQSLYVCACVYEYVHMCICMCVCVCVYLCVYLHVCICMCMHMCVHICVCTCMCMCVCICVRVYACVLGIKDLVSVL